MQAFHPIGNTSNIAVTATSQALAITAGVSDAVSVTNSGTQVIFVAFGDASVTVTVATGIPLLSNNFRDFGRRSETHMAVIAGAVGSTAYLTKGELVT